MTDELRREKDRLSIVVDRFAEEMKEKLYEKAEEGFRGWDECSPGDDELDEIMKKLVRHTIAIAFDGEDEAIDVANLAMMIWLSDFNEPAKFGILRP